ncbi:hypothetical protein AVEN_210797-1 [Araneus ventricosus]|uniref:Uncharacterized protein n=1 Tax=Araneus ventricosus TaxID=182803 RepID=A0A4Y2CMD6_ARAVE|nr:hypothetical protein AVEN_210797-1 [Araneus ventricosus]
MDVNKNQGLMLQRAGLHLLNAAFTDGQLYVTFSRISKTNNIFVPITENDKKSRTSCADVVQVNLLAAKSRVAPVKTTTIPRLELLAATVGARLCRSVLSALQWDYVDTHYWTDSTTVLGWIQREELWSVFVNNRVQEIRKLTDPTLWKHLPGAQNPTDLPSRRCYAHQLSCSRWWEGPKWLLQTQENWSVTKPVFDEQSVLKERRKTNPTSKSLPFLCSLNQTENFKCFL